MTKKLFLFLFISIISIFFLIANDNSSDLLLPLNDGITTSEFLSELELEVVKELNLARTNPKQYAEYLKEYKKYYNGMYLEIPGKVRLVTNEGVKAVDEAINALLSYSPLKPLKISKGISLAAKDHVNDLGSKGTTGHTGSDGSSPFTRMNRYGKWENTAGENIDYGNNEARYIIFSLIIDDGVSSRGHRKNIFESRFNVVGVACGAHKKYSYICVMGFAAKYTEK